jgi:hypothetical protein
VKVNLLSENFQELDLSMGVNQVSMLEMILDTNNSQACVSILEFMTQQEDIVDRERILMSCIDRIFEM